MGSEMCIRDRAVARLGTIVRLGEAHPVVFFSSAVDFILPVNCRRSTTAVRAGGAACRGSASGEFILPAVPDAARTAVVDRRQLTGKMKSTALAIGMSGTASPRCTIVLAMAKANSVILGRGLHLSLDRYLAWAVPGKCRYSRSKPAVPEGGTLSCLRG